MDNIFNNMIEKIDDILIYESLLNIVAILDKRKH